jgi:hypothetical protein
MNLTDHLQIIKTQQIGQLRPLNFPLCSALKAKDFLDGNMSLHHKDMMYKIVKKYEDRQFKDVTEELTKMVIEKTALTYLEPPTREVYLKTAGGSMKTTTKDEAATESYEDLLYRSSFDGTAIELDKISRLLGLGITLGWWVEETQSVHWNILDRSNCSVDRDMKTGQVRSMLIMTEGPHELGMTEDCYTLYTPDSVTDYISTAGGTLRPYGMPAPHKYGGIPAAFLYDKSIPRSGIFPPGEPWQSLIALNETVNLLDTIYAYSARWQAFATRVSNIRTPDGFVNGPDSTVEPPKDMMVKDVVFKYESPEVNVKEFTDWLHGVIERVGDQWGVTIRYGGNATQADSALKLVVQENWNLTARKRRQQNAKRFEQQLYRMTAMLANANGYKLPTDATVYTTFKEVALPTDRLTDWQIAQQQMASGVLGKAQYIKQENPEMDDSDISKMLEAIAKEGAGSMLSVAKSRLEQAMAGAGAGADQQNQQAA